MPKRGTCSRGRRARVRAWGPIWQSYTSARVGLRTVGACEPRQIRKEAALSIPFQVCGSPGPFLSKVGFVTRGSLLGSLAIAAVALAYALPMQSPGCGQNAHYAATRSFAEGHAYIDRYATETCDVVRRGGHVYAAKGPALDLWSVPWYLVLRSVGAVPPNPNAHLGYPAAMVGVPLRALWQMGLWSVVLPALALLLLVRRTVDRLEPGLGAPVAVILGLGTLLLPFSTLVFAHVPATMLAFLAFTLLFEKPSVRRSALAGAAAGLAVATDLPLVVPAVALGVYAAAREPRVQRVGAYAAGLLVGLFPLFAFGIWAFGSPFELAYSGAAIDPGAGGVEQAHVHGLVFTLTSPHPHFAIDVLLSQRGLVVLAPVVAAAAAGIALLWRRSLRAEAALIGGLAVAEIAWNAFRPTYELALGGWVPGPRFLIPLLPFLCLALAPVLRRIPATVGVLALVSIGAMVVATSAEPLLSNDDTHHWISRIVAGNFVPTVLSLWGSGHGWLGIMPFLLLVAAAVLAAGATIRPTLERRDLALAAASVIAWIVVEHGAPALLQVDRLVGQSYGAAAAVAVVSGFAWALIRLFAGRPAAAAPGLLLLAFAARRFDQHTKWALLLALLVLGALALQPALADRVRRRGIPA
ncbi:MAG: hypothetical protein JWM06_1805 [Actinomycetia bacterium]|nr:hypothetical protein [Actinomycetes bacterium]